MVSSRQPEAQPDLQSDTSVQEFTTPERTLTRPPIAVQTVDSPAPLVSVSAPRIPVAPSSESQPLAIQPWSDSVSMVLGQPPNRFSQALLLGGLIFAISAGGWAWFGHVNEVSRAVGRLVPHGETFQLHATETGKITSLMVQEGQTVSQGQRVALFDAELAREEVERLQQLMLAYRQELLQRQAMIEQIHREAVTRQQIAGAEARSQVVAIAQARNTSATLSQLQRQNQQEVETYQQRVNHIRPLVEEGALSREQLFSREQQLRERQNTVIRSQGELERAIAEQSRMRALLEQKQAEGERSQIEAEHRIQELQAGLIELQRSISNTQSRMATAQTRLKQLEVVAPVAGVVSRLNVRNPGVVVQPGQTIAEIRPADAPLVLQAILPTKEAGLLQPGMAAKLKFDAFPYQEYGVIPGKVLAISPDSQALNSVTTSGKAAVGGQVVYRVDIALEKTTVVNPAFFPVRTSRNVAAPTVMSIVSPMGTPTIALQAGQTAQAEIVIRRRRILDVLFDPIRRVKKGGLNL